MKFISPDYIHRYIRKLAEILDIEFTTNWEKIKTSNKYYLIWNPYGYLAHPLPSYINKYNHYVKLKKEERPTYIVERGALPNTIFIDKNGFNYESSSYNQENWDKPLTEPQKNQVKAYIEEFKTNKSSLEPQKNQRLKEEEFYKKLNIEKEDFKKVVFVPLQMHRDTVTILWCDWVGNVTNFIAQIVQLAQRHPDTLFLLKNHPAEKAEPFFYETANIKIVDKFHYKDCIQYSDLVITINSGIGLQAMIWGKPAIITGKSFYQFDEINIKANSLEDIEVGLKSIKKPNVEKVERFIYYLRFVFYTTCHMQKTFLNTSFPKIINSINYETPEGERVSVKEEIKIESHMEILGELIKILPRYCLTKTTCLETIQGCELKPNTDTLYIATDISPSLWSLLKQYDYDIVPSQNKAIKSGVTIYFEPMPANTKKMTLFAEQVNVPLPVVRYLEKLYGKDWKHYNSKKFETDIKVKNRDIRVAYLFNNYGWIFEFEAQYYKKHSSLNVIPMLESDLPNILNERIDVVVCPSAWHYQEIFPKNFARELARKGIKIVSQYNSNIEFKYCTPTAHLIMSSSPKIYKYLDKTYGYTKQIWLPHFIDTEVFIPEYRYNNFTVGWCGNFKNRYKRPHIITALDYPIYKKANYHGHLKKGRDHSKMAKFYNDIDVLIIPSISEGTPMPMMEAMACGKTVLITDVGIANLLLDDFFIIPNTADEEILSNFNKKLKALEVTGRNSLSDIGKRNRDTIKKLCWKDNVHILDEIYINLAHDKLDNIKKIATKFNKEKFNNEGN